MSPRRIARELSGFLVLLLILASTAASSARAEFGPIQLVSKSTTEQADSAVSPAISGDGQFVAFVGRLGGREGVFRKDVQTGALMLVAKLETSAEARSADPSISADGRYVAFTTKVPLDPKNDLQPHSPGVYVADLATVPPTYELASALDGCDPATSETPCGLTYPGSEESGGSVAAGRVALSADGRSVAFLTRAKSDLTTGDPEELETPAGQVAVRRLGTDETILITERRVGGGPVPRAGADPGSEGAAISGDGTTVAWVGVDLPEQVPMLSDEEAALRQLEEGEPLEEQVEYHEPLWRRIPSPLEPNPPSRRIVGGGDPLGPGCPAGGTLAIAACLGPYPSLTGPRQFSERIEGVEGRGWGVTTPQLDRNGEVVAFVANPNEVKDLFVVNMAPGLSRRQAVRRLTQWVNPIPGAVRPEEELFKVPLLPQTGEIYGCAISSDGRRIAFATARQVFPLAPPTLITPPAPGAKEGTELFQVDLGAETIERLTPGGEKQSWEGGAGEGLTPSYSENGLFLAFASKAFNLVEGDTNQASDAFVVESPPPAQVGEVKISPRPSEISVRPLWRITATARSLPDGRVRVVVGVPGAGEVRVNAKARTGRKLKTRRAASAHRRATTAGAESLTLRLPRKLRKLAHHKGGLDAEVDVDFAASEGKPLSAALEARFIVRVAAKSGKPGKKGKSR